MEATTCVGPEAVRDVIEKFNKTVGELNRLVAEQEEYINLLEKRLREGQEEAWRKTSLREHKLMLRLVKKDQKLREMTARTADLKAQLAPGSVKLRQNFLVNIEHDHDYLTSRNYIKHDHDYITPGNYIKHDHDYVTSRNLGAQVCSRG